MEIKVDNLVLTLTKAKNQNNDSRRGDKAIFMKALAHLSFPREHAIEILNQAVTLVEFVECLYMLVDESRALLNMKSDNKVLQKFAEFKIHAVGKDYSFVKIHGDYCQRLY